MYQFSWNHALTQGPWAEKKISWELFLSSIPTTMLWGQLAGKPVHKYGQLAVFTVQSSSSHGS